MKKQDFSKKVRINESNHGYSPSNKEVEKSTISWMLTFNPHLNPDYSEQELRELTDNIFDKYNSVCSCSDFFGDGEFIMVELLLTNNEYAEEKALDFQRFISQKYGIHFGEDDLCELIIDYPEGYFDEFTTYEIGMYQQTISE